MSTSTEGVPVPEWDLADRLTKSLRVAGMTVQDMADYLAVHRNTVSAWINGRTPISGPAIRAWADRTGVDFWWLTTGEPGSPPDPPKHPLPMGPQEDGAQVHQLHPRGVRGGVVEHDERIPEPVSESRWSWYARALADEGPPKPVDLGTRLRGARLTGLPAVDLEAA